MSDDWQRKWKIISVLFTSITILKSEYFVRSVVLVHLVLGEPKKNGMHKKFRSSK